ncbi:MAG TPA: hypothetical protein VM146_06595 [Steroidobacteraceae bacterium]|nr:hypothetical protein [Steroidobacteraceae bacterium]
MIGVAMAGHDRQSSKTMVSLRTSIPFIEAFAICSDHVPVRGVMSFAVGYSIAIHGGNAIEQMSSTPKSAMHFSFEKIANGGI